jgi:hypothetical protein
MENDGHTELRVQEQEGFMSTAIDSVSAAGVGSQILDAIEGETKCIDY